ncbi:XRE family transcriptional regulator [Paracidovorax avenae]|uniref:XRE family transcriptional regulator n=1 Tax=Paracidovorax avenae TaxID=80867 RepID=UPI0012602B90|nr:XRE family transcriptional regulator [Paracidovorax avenae]
MRWISAHNLQEWASSLAARTTFPGLIADLIIASTPNITDFRFPSREKGQVRGFDGVLEATGVPPFVPDGTSIWEFGVSADLVEKADHDFEKRTKEVDAAIRENTTFVFATPRTWDRSGKQIPNWLSDKRSLGKWKGVECFDGVALEHWLDRHPAVASRYARYELGLAPTIGACSSSEFWDEFSMRFTPTLTEDVLLAGREAQGGELLRRLSEGGSRLAFAADSADEVIAFVVAAIRRAAPESRAFLEARAMVVDGVDAARQLASRKGLIFLPRGQARQFVGLLAQAGPTVISAGADEQRGQHDVLARPTSSELAKAFVSMGMAESEGYELARRCGRSLAVLARQKPSGTAEPPEWLQASEALIPALLAGGWKPSVQADADVLKTLGGKATYEEVEAPLRRLTKLKDSPIDRVDDVWAMRSSVDAFVHLGHLIGSEHLARFAEQANVVFSRVLAPM